MQAIAATGGGDADAAVYDAVRLERVARASRGSIDSDQQSEHDLFMTSAIRALAAGETDEALRFVLGELDDLENSLVIRKAAAEALATWREPEASDALLTVLFGPDDELRLVAAKSLVSLDKVGYRSDLEDAVRISEDEFVRKQLTRLLRGR